MTPSDELDPFWACLIGLLLTLVWLRMRKLARDRGEW